MYKGILANAWPFVLPLTNISFFSEIYHNTFIYLINKTLHRHIKSHSKAVIQLRFVSPFFR